MTAYYNEIDPYAAQWLRNLISEGLIAKGDVDERSIIDVKPTELMGYTQCHFFAGIGIWSLALRNAGWPDDREVWTGSCPCQPFSTAGAGKGFADERHLWPDFHWLIQQRRPAVVFGEQVSSKAVDTWVDLVQADLEAMDYFFGCIAFPAAGISAPHIRDRLFWVADTYNERPQGQRGPFQINESEGWEAEKRYAAKSAMASHYRDWECNKGADGISRLLPPNFGERTNVDTSRVGRLRADEKALTQKSKVGMLRAYGNAINAEAARVFISSYMECVL